MAYRAAKGKPASREVTVEKPFAVKRGAQPGANWPDNELKELLAVSDGRLAAAKARGRKSGERKRLHDRMKLLLCKWDPEEDDGTRPYVDMSHEWMCDHLVRLAQCVGAGEVGSGPSAITATAAIQLAASRWLFDRAWQLTSRSVDEATKMMLAASRMADSSRQNIIAAHEICAREATSRPTKDKLSEARSRLLTTHGEDKDDG